MQAIDDFYRHNNIPCPQSIKYELEEYNKSAVFARIIDSKKRYDGLAKQMKICHRVTAIYTVVMFDEMDPELKNAFANWKFKYSLTLDCFYQQAKMIGWIVLVLWEISYSMNTLVSFCMATMYASVSFIMDPCSYCQPQNVTYCLHNNFAAS